MMVRQAHHKRNARGFTLVELVIMTAVGAVLLTGLGIATQAQLKASVDNRNYLIALNLAKRQMAIVNNATYPTAAAEAAQTVDSAFPNFVPTLEVVEIDTNGGVNLREIRVRVRLGSASGPVLVALYTYRTNLVTFGTGT